MNQSRLSLQSVEQPEILTGPMMMMDLREPHNHILQVMPEISHALNCGTPPVFDTVLRLIIIDFNKESPLSLQA